jgi:hypothetical protein
VILFAEGDRVVEEARYTGTHTGIWRNPDGAEVPATGKKLDFPLVGVFRVENGKISSIRIYYDQIEVFTQARTNAGSNAELTSRGRVTSSVLVVYVQLFRGRVTADAGSRQQHSRVP